MPLSDIFTPSFLMCLGTCLLLIGIFGMYLMQKLSEQNHKIASMFELVSTIAEEMNVIRSNVMVPQFKPQFNAIIPPIGGQSVKQELLPVSDDDEEDDDDEDDDEDDEDDEDEDEDGDEDELKIKSINFNNMEGSTFNLGNEIENLEETQILEDEDDDDNDEDDDEDDDESDEDTEECTNLDFEKVSNEPIINLKSINISDLEEHKSFEIIDYKKLSLQKLKSLALEKGVVSDASKLKKNELLKLLGSD